jgi:hypothetical protein
MSLLYTYDMDGIFIAEKEHVKFQPVPARSTLTSPPNLTDTQLAQWNGSEWIVLSERPVSAPPSPPSKEQQQVQRAAAYTAEADPLFFKYQRGEGTEQDWLDKIKEIRERFPYPTEE